LLCCEQLILQNPQTGDVYNFELRDCLICDDELDGWREIPLKPDDATKQNGGNADGKDAETKLPGVCFK